ncbi:MAG: hypothetical protein EXS32_02675 [Opitutus sp.]|nr:hypothetical protein [Opitutus sp.]
MKRFLVIGCMGAALVADSARATGLGPADARAAPAADENFSKTVRAADFSAAGLAKLSPEELARLDTLVRDYKTGALAAAQREVAAVQVAHAAVTAKEKKSDGGLLQKAKVMLTPGTAVEYAATESRIVGDFAGWQSRTILTLENGERWQVVANSDGYYTPPMSRPKATIRPASFGGFWLEIEGVNARVRVMKVGGGK